MILSAKTFVTYFLRMISFVLVLCSTVMYDEKSCKTSVVVHFNRQTLLPYCVFLFPDGTCNVNGTLYRDGGRVSSTCGQHCSCQAGRVFCESACPETPKEPPVTEHCAHFALKNDSASCCLEWICVASPQHCLHEGTMYLVGQSFTDLRNCRLRNCTCELDKDGQAVQVCVGGCPEIYAAMLLPTSNCSHPAVFQAVDACQCPVLKCTDDNLEGRAISRGSS